MGILRSVIADARGSRPRHQSSAMDFGRQATPAVVARDQRTYPKSPVSAKQQKSQPPEHTAEAHSNKASSIADTPTVISQQSMPRGKTHRPVTKRVESKPKDLSRLETEVIIENPVDEKAVHQPLERKPEPVKLPEPVVEHIAQTNIRQTRQILLEKTVKQTIRAASNPQQKPIQRPSVEAPIKTTIKPADEAAEVTFKQPLRESPSYAVKIKEPVQYPAPEAEKPVQPTRVDYDVSETVARPSEPESNNPEPEIVEKTQVGNFPLEPIPTAVQVEQTNVTVMSQQIDRQSVASIPPGLISEPSTPEVRIGQVDVIIESPSQIHKPIPAPARPATSQASRLYLRRL